MPVQPESLKNLKPSLPGDPPKPNSGRPKGSLNIKTIGEKWLKMKEKIKHPITGEEVKLNQMDILFLTLLKEGRGGNVQATREYFDRVFGKSIQKQEIDFGDNASTEITVEIVKNKNAG